MYITYRVDAGAGVGVSTGAGGVVEVCRRSQQRLVQQGQMRRHRALHAAAAPRTLAPARDTTPITTKVNKNILKKEKQEKLRTTFWKTV